MAVANGESEGDIVLGAPIGVSFVHKTDNGKPWNSLDVISNTLVAIQRGLLCGEILDTDGVLVKTFETISIKDLFKVGPTHHLIGHLNGKDAIGAFTLNPIDTANNADILSMYRALWNANSKSQKTLLVFPTHKGTVYSKIDANRRWGERTCLFYQRNMTWSSQSIVAAMTGNPAMGGSAWLGLQHHDENVMKAFALWANSIYGMIVYWATGARSQQDKRSRLQVRGMSKLHCPRFDNFSKQTLDTVGHDFDTLKTLELQPACFANVDDNRKKINNAVSRMLGVPDYDSAMLSELWCSEPSIKKTRSNKRTLNRC